MNLLATLLLFGLGALGAQGQGFDTDRVYVLHVEHDSGAFSFINKTTGFFAGFAVDIAKEVCNAAGVKCEFVWDIAQHCYDKTSDGVHRVLGVGLQGRYYDGCVGWVVNVQRIHIARFSVPFVKLSYSYLYVKSDSDLVGTTVTLDQLKTLKIGYRAGWAGDYACLNRVFGLSIENKESNVQWYESGQSLNAAVQNGSVAAGFSFSGGISADGLVKVNVVEDKPEVKCNLAGSAVMTRKDSPFPEIWNYGYNQILRNGVYERLCKYASDNYAGTGTDMADRCVDGFDAVV